MRIEKPLPRQPDADQFLRLILESTTDFAILSMDPDGIVTTWNPGAESLTGYGGEEIIGMAADVLFTPDDRAAGAPGREREQAAAAGRAEDDRWHLRKDGTRFWASGLLMPLTDRSLGFVKILSDRTAQHFADVQLRESEERFRVLATHIPQLVFRTRPDGLRTWGSPQWIDFTGMSLDQSMNYGWLEAIHPDDRAPTIAAWADAQVAGEYYAEHRVRRNSDGVYRWHQTRARPINAGADPTSDWVGTMTDVHDMHGMQDRQQLLLAELQHRTRNLLAVVQAVARQTRRSATSMEQFSTDFEDRLRALSRVQSLLARTDHHNISLRALIDAELLAHTNGGRIEVAGPDIPLSPATAQALGLALHELVTNAVKYGALAGGGGALRISWRVDKEGPCPRLVLEWIEDGVAMPPGPPPRRGYGMELIESALPYQLEAETRVEFMRDGLRCTIGLPL